MTAQEYLNLDPQHRESILWRNGTFIDSVVVSGKTYHLFYIKWFYAEVVVCHYEQRVTEITAFVSGPQFDKYVEQIQLSDLI